MRATASSTRPELSPDFERPSRYNFSPAGRVVLSTPSTCLPSCSISATTSSRQSPAFTRVSGVPGSLATAVLDEALDDERWFVTEHAAWSFSARSPHRPAMDRLASMVTDGGFRGMVAQRTLAGWAHGDRNGVLLALGKSLEHADGAGRVALIETVGAIPGTAATALLETVAFDNDDADAQLAAIAALGWRPSDPDPLERLALDDTDVGEIALLALIDKTLSTRTTDVIRPNGRVGHRIAQVVIHAEFDERLIRSGAGDNGGLATLVGQLSTAFADRADVAQITTITRGSTGDAISDAFFGCDDKERLASVPFGGRGTVDRRSSWEHRLAVERGVRRVFLAGARPDVVHLRMADVGTLAAGRVARQLGIPVVFTAAPDPHVVLGQLDPAKVSRCNFGVHDELEHYWFRARMVERMTNQADQVVLLPRGDDGELRRAFGERAAGPLQRTRSSSPRVWTRCRFVGLEPSSASSTTKPAGRCPSNRCVTRPRGPGMRSLGASPCGQRRKAAPRQGNGSSGESVGRRWHASSHHQSGDHRRRPCTTDGG